MSKEKVLISVRGGCIENIISTKDNVQFVIIDYDNFENDCTKAIQEIDNLYSPDFILSNKELDKHIETIKQAYKKSVVNDGVLLIPVEETPKQVVEEIPCDVYIKDEGELAGIICNTSKAKKTAIGSGFGNDYSFMPGQYRFDIFEEQIPVIIEWCEKQNLTYEEC